LAGRKVFADPSSYSTAGLSSQLLKGHAILGEAGGYTLAGESADTKAARILSVGNGLYLVTGAASGLQRHRFISCSPSGYTVTGASAGTLADRIIPVGDGSYVVVGQDVSFLVSGRSLGIDPGTYTLTGSSVGVVPAFGIVVDGGAYIIGGEDVHLDRERGILGYCLGTDTGNIHEVGQSHGHDAFLPITAYWQSRTMDFADQLAELGNVYKTVGRVKLIFIDTNETDITVSVSNDDGLTWTSVTKTVGSGSEAVSEEFFDFWITGKEFRFMVTHASADDNFQFVRLEPEITTQGAWYATQ